jgi:type III secretion protein HrpB1
MATATVTPKVTQQTENVLAFRTVVGGVMIKGGESKTLGVVDTSKFNKIRIVTDERVGSTCNIWVRLTVTEGTEWVAFLDHFMLTPHAEVTKVYDVPCKMITVAIDGVGVATNSGTVDVLMYGQN